MFAVGLCIQIFNHFGINYLYIFEVDPANKMVPGEFYKISAVLLFLTSACLLLEVTQIREKSDKMANRPWFALALFVIIIIYFMQPCLRCGHRKSRKSCGFSFL